MYLIPPSETQIAHIKNEDFYQPLHRLEEDVTQLMEWLTKQPHLPNITGELVYLSLTFYVNIKLNSSKGYKTRYINTVH